MIEKKEETILALASDERVSELLQLLSYNWDVAAQRMETIARERREQLYDDCGVEAMAVFCRMERIGALMVALNSRPQAFLLGGFRQLLHQMHDDHRMDCELAAMLTQKSSAKTIDGPTFWERLKELYLMKGRTSLPHDAIVRKLFQTRFLPNLDDEENLRWMQTLVQPAQGGEQELQDAQQELMERMVFLGQNLGQVASDSRAEMAVGLTVVHELTELLADMCDLSKMDDETVSNIFETAKAELMESSDWQEYWADHLKHLELQGELADQLAKDREEVETWLADVHHYLYNKWNESPEAFGRALKSQQLGDEDVLKLLFYLAKKDAIALETESPDQRMEHMQENALQAAMKLRELAADKYYDQYEALCRQILENKLIAPVLADYNSSKYNQGFNMQRLCKIIGYLHREYHLFGSYTPEDMGKLMGDRYVKNSRDSISNYIKKKSSDLTAQIFSELDAIMKK